jgi:hypothetical protein
VLHKKLQNAAFSFFVNIELASRTHPPHPTLPDSGYKNSAPFLSLQKLAGYLLVMPMNKFSGSRLTYAKLGPVKHNMEWRKVNN